MFISFPLPYSPTQESVTNIYKIAIIPVKKTQGKFLIMNENFPAFTEIMPNFLTFLVANNIQFLL
ncbi:hypothetical protein D5R40_13765 [Okeania hirsuta]|uniref:Uncharacterized protein n=1 Tax=Okeania hirsuta TaxID=1458930 RepID=A0A3N6PAJ7_9CYAN|nr:hypothetical protein D4Z78_17415 [Okeania hirsuta]RQH43080.1 hypothetical protein D5R40_13765 [Okeania hirsuta]